MLNYQRVKKNLENIRKTKDDHRMMLVIHMYFTKNVSVVYKNMIFGWSDWSDEDLTKFVYSTQTVCFYPLQYGIWDGTMGIDGLTSMWYCTHKFLKKRKQNGNLAHSNGDSCEFGDGRFDLSIPISITIHNGGYGLGDGSRPPQCHRRVAMMGGYPSEVIKKKKRVNLLMSLSPYCFFSSLSFYGEWTIPGTKRQPAILNLVDAFF